MAGTRLFRDEVYGPLRFVFQADHRLYKRLGIYDFPQKDWRTRMANAIMIPLLRIPRFRQGFKTQINPMMIRPYQKLLKD